MKFSTWPKPPIHNRNQPPELPEAYSLFGTPYKIINGNPCLDIPFQQLDITHIKECVNKSFDLFTKLIQSFDSAYLDEIRDLHVHINEQINKAKVFEGDTAIEESKITNIKRKLEIYEKLKESILKQ